MMQRHEVNNEAYDRASLAEEAVLAGIRSASEIGKRILLPEVRRLDQLFLRFEPVEDLTGYKSRAVHAWDVDGCRDLVRIRSAVPLMRGPERRPGRAELSSFCGVRHGTDLDVEPRPEVVELLSRTMLICDGYVINFGITVREGGTALVEAHYNAICGSRWLAIVPASEVPGSGA